MFTVYVLKSVKNGKRYIGYTSKDTPTRLKEHNSGTNKFTKHNSPFEFFYEEKFKTKVEALGREKFLKSGQGRKFLDNIHMGP
ncbi:MAG: GIY-YIG nuclease family protein [Candidatus Paceibacterota bacterium]